MPLLKDYPDKQRNEILDYLFKPDFGASISALYVEIGGDCNSTQGVELSHMHTRTDENYRRGYEWWIMQEAKRRNAEISLDAAGWGAPAWVGNGNFYSQDMCDYYVKWIKGLHNVYGLDLEAIGCRNERAANENFVKMFHKTLDADGLSQVKIHAFDDWPSNKWNWCKDLEKDPGLCDAVSILSGHTLGLVYEANGDTPAWVVALSRKLHKPIWDTEEHVYEEGYKCEIDIVKSFNLNFINAGATKTVNWYLVDGEYDIMPFKHTPGMLIADSPWSGHYTVREALWGYAHYGQFCKLGWQYLPQACGILKGGGSFVTLKAPRGGDYSIILETGRAKTEQTLSFNLKGYLSRGKLCVWRSNSREQFIRQPDLKPVKGKFSLKMEPDSIYSLSTTTGQQKGVVSDIPPEQGFPLPFTDTFQDYDDAASYGYLPHYTADISGGFELADSPDGTGQCLRQVLGEIAPASSTWKNEAETVPHTILGDSHWTNYAFSCNIFLDEQAGAAGIMGRVSESWKPQGYLFSLSYDGTWTLVSTGKMKDKKAAATILASGSLGQPADGWHNLNICFGGDGTEITGYIDSAPVLKVRNADWPHGMVGLFTQRNDRKRITACFRNLVIAPGNDTQGHSVRPPTGSPIYSNVHAGIPHEF